MGNYNVVFINDRELTLAMSARIFIQGYTRIIFKITIFHTYGGKTKVLIIYGHRVGYTEDHYLIAVYGHAQVER